MMRRLRFDVAAAYVARFALTLVSLTMWALPRREKITMLTRQSDRTPSDFALLRDALVAQNPSTTVVIRARMMPAGVVGKAAYGLHLLKDIYHVETSRIVIVDGYSIIVSAVRHSRGLTVVQMWHALGALKKFGLSILGREGGRDPKLAKAMRMHDGYDLVVASAERCRAPFAEALGVGIDQVIVAPLPRVDRLRDREERAKARATFEGLHPELAGRRIALFAPTFRTGDRSQDAEAIEITEALDAVGYATVTKLHPLVPTPDDPRLHTVPQMSTQELLLVADIFITDYSSAIFEAAVAGVPSYLYAGDLDDYVESRDFYMAYPGDLGLPMSRTVTELAAQIGRGACTPEDIAATAANHVEIPEKGSAAQSLAAAIVSVHERRTR